MKIGKREIAEMRLPKVILITTHALQSKCVVFYICLFTHFMYILHSKAIFMVSEIINPAIKKVKISTISLTSSLSIDIEVQR